MSGDSAVSTKHTPGPWQVHPRWPECVIPCCDADKLLGGSVDPDDEAKRFCKIISNERGTEYPQFYRSRVSPDEARANARLIASAPELAERVKTLTGFVQEVIDWAHQHPLDSQLQAMRGRAESVLSEGKEAK